METRAERGDDGSFLSRAGRAVTRDPRALLPLAIGLAVLLLFPVSGSASPTGTLKAGKTPPQNNGAPIDADTLPKGSVDADTTVRWLNTSGSYQLEVQNTSSIGYLDTFNWSPPPSMTITAVTGAVGAKCSLQNGEIHCVGKLKPPKCTCLPGGEMTVNFTATGNNPTFADGYWTYYGIEGAFLQIETVTPVPYHIPSFLPGSSADLPLCKKGQKSTKARPCTTG